MNYRTLALRGASVWCVGMVAVIASCGGGNNNYGGSYVGYGAAPNYSANVGTGVNNGAGVGTNGTGAGTGTGAGPASGYCDSPASPLPVQLPIQYVQQACDEWCWAATLQMISTYYSRATTACQLASDVSGQQCCQYAACSYSACDMAAPTAEMDEILGQGLGIHGDDAQGTLSEEQLQVEITNGRPVLIGFLGPFSGHVAVLDGYTPGSPTIYHVDDPWPTFGPMEVDYITLSQGPMGMPWQETLYHLSPNENGCSQVVNPTCECRNSGTGTGSASTATSSSSAGGAGCGTCAGGQVCENGACVCPPAFPYACPSSSQVCWNAPTACNTIADCSGKWEACGKPDQTVNCTTSMCDCPAEYPVLCNSSAPTACWTPNTACSTIVECPDKTWHACDSAQATYNCSTGQCG